jgi:hypothetical protein
MEIGKRRAAGKKLRLEVHGQGGGAGEDAGEVRDGVGEEVGLVCEKGR